MTLVYSAIPIFNVLFTYGLETAFFRFSSKEDNERDVYNTTATSIIISTFLLGLPMLFFYKELSVLAGLESFPGLMLMSVLIIMIDTLSVIPFAKLRKDGRPKKYAAIKVGGILVNIFFTFFFLWWCPLRIEQDPGTILTLVYKPEINGVYYVVLANLFQAAFTLLLLQKELRQVQLKIDKVLWKKIMLYSMPLVLAGLGGVINETFDRLMLKYLSVGDELYKTAQVGIYGACYKLSILITLFIQAFRMGAEPFFFKEYQSDNPQRTYARVLKFFVIVISFMFLVVALYLPIWKYFIDSKFWEGLVVVPVLLLANMFLGIYLNLSVWYKLGNKTIVGAYITFAGVAITLVINYMFIPTYGYIACAWATFLCYGSMMAISYLWGQRVYPIPYAWKKLTSYIVIVVVLYFIHHYITMLWDAVWFSHILATLLLLAYAWFISVVERKELIKLPVVGKYFSAKP